MSTATYRTVTPADPDAAQAMLTRHLPRFDGTCRTCRTATGPCLPYLAASIALAGFGRLPLRTPGATHPELALQERCRSANVPDSGSPYAATITDYCLRDLLVCATASCGQRLKPLQLAGQPRSYYSPCGCRLMPVDASAVEKRVHKVVARRSAMLDITEADACHALYRALLVEVAIGATADELTFTWRTRTRPPESSGSDLRTAPNESKHGGDPQTTKPTLTQPPAGAPTKPGPGMIHRRCSGLTHECTEWTMYYNDLQH